MAVPQGRDLGGASDVPVVWIGQAESEPQSPVLIDGDDSGLSPPFASLAVGLGRA